MSNEVDFNSTTFSLDTHIYIFYFLLYKEHFFFNDVKVLLMKIVSFLYSNGKMDEEKKNFLQFEVNLPAHLKKSSLMLRLLFSNLKYFV